MINEKIHNRLILFEALPVKRLIENLRSFNSKERFFLIGHILGNTNFTPCPEFKKNIEDLLHLRIPNELFTAMDYHLDWLYASLYLSFTGENESGIISNSDHLIKATQEDIDFIIAFAEDTSFHIILVEAKCVTGWTNKQMDSKAMRFGEIFGADGKRWPGVYPHFLLSSPRRPKRLNVLNWPSWMIADGEVPWIELPIPTKLRKVTRCNPEGLDDEEGLFWKTSWR